jgi:hypothetical protein
VLAVVLVTHSTALVVVAAVVAAAVLGWALVVARMSSVAVLGAAFLARRQPFAIPARELPVVGAIGLLVLATDGLWTRLDRGPAQRRGGPEPALPSCHYRARSRLPARAAARAFSRLACW